VPTPPQSLATIFDDIVKANDVRGLVDSQLTEDVVGALGRAFAAAMAADGATRVAVGYDMRASSPVLARVFADGVRASGLDVVDVGLCSTDALYYGSGALAAPGAMFTASHNPPQYNGVKLCRSLARPIGRDSGLAQIRAEAEHLLESAGGVLPPAAATGAVERFDLLSGYAAHLRSLVPGAGAGGRRLRVVVDAGNGMAGLTTPAVLGDAVGLPPLDLDVVPLYFELDGTFPNHEANPLDPANLVDLQRAVLEHRADLGLAFDGDADRCFVIDERGLAVSPSAVTALVASREIVKEHAAGRPGVVIHNCITSWSVPEVIAECGGTAVRTKVGHAFIKKEMAERDAVFGGEHSAHYYFRDFWFADTGMLAALHVLAALAEQEGPLSALVAEYERYAASGEINSRVADVGAALAAVERRYAGAEGVSIDHLDGLTVANLAERWWFNLRPSNTEPLLRLNSEAADPATMARLRDEVLAVVRG